MNDRTLMIRFVNGTKLFVPLDDEGYNEWEAQLDDPSKFASLCDEDGLHYRIPTSQILWTEWS